MNIVLDRVSKVTGDQDGDGRQVKAETRMAEVICGTKARLRRRAS